MEGERRKRTKMTTPNMNSVEQTMIKDEPSVDQNTDVYIDDLKKGISNILVGNQN